MPRPPSSGTIAAGSLVFVCAGLIAPGATAPMEYAFSQWPVVYDTSVQATRPRLFLDKARLRFTAVRTAETLTAVTPAQTITVTQVGAGSVPWTVDVRDTNGQVVDYVQLSPASGTGAGTFTVSVVPSNQLPHGFSGLSADIGLVIRLTAPNADNSPFPYSLSAEGYILAGDLDEAGRLLGVFHSHTSSGAYPSPADRDLRQSKSRPAPDGRQDARGGRRQG